MPRYQVSVYRTIGPLVVRFCLSSDLLKEIFSPSRFVYFTEKISNLCFLTFLQETTVLMMVVEL